MLVLEIEGLVMAKSMFKKIYDTKFGWVARIGGKEYESFYFITLSQGVVSKEIGIKLTKHDVERITASNGDSSVISSIIQNSNEYIDVE